MTMLVALLLLLLSAVPAHADYLYTFYGLTFEKPTVWPHQVYTTGLYLPTDRLTGTFQVWESFVPSGPFPQDWRAGITTYSFTDGHQTLTDANSTAHFRLPPGVGFPLFAGLIDIVTASGGLIIEGWSDSGLTAWLGASTFGEAPSQAKRGGHIVFATTWTVEHVPEPGHALVLAAVGLLAIGWWRWLIR